MLTESFKEIIPLTGYEKESTSEKEKRKIINVNIRKMNMQLNNEGLTKEEMEQRLQ